STNLAILPPLIRDSEGNRVNTITYQNATPASLIPLNTAFSINGDITLDLTGTAPVLLMRSQDDIRIRLFLDPYKLDGTLNLSRDLPVDLSMIYLHEKANLSGRSTPLNIDMVDYARFKELNTDYASTSVKIPL